MGENEVHRFCSPIWLAFWAAVAKSSQMSGISRLRILSWFTLYWIPFFVGHSSPWGLVKSLLTEALTYPFQRLTSKWRSNPEFWVDSWQKRSCAGPSHVLVLFSCKRASPRPMSRSKASSSPNSNVTNMERRAPLRSCSRTHRWRRGREFQNPTYAVNPWLLEIMYVGASSVGSAGSLGMAAAERAGAFLEGAMVGQDAS